MIFYYLRMAQGNKDGTIEHSDRFLDEIIAEAARRWLLQKENKRKNYSNDPSEKYWKKSEYSQLLPDFYKVPK